MRRIVRLSAAFLGAENINVSKCVLKRRVIITCRSVTRVLLLFPDIITQKCDGDDGKWLRVASVRLSEVESAPKTERRERFPGTSFPQVNRKHLPSRHHQKHISQLFSSRRKAKENEVCLYVARLDCLFAFIHNNLDAIPPRITSSSSISF